MIKNNKIYIKLEAINESNWEACAKLKLTKDQKNNLPNNLHSIAELNFYPQTKAVAILNEKNIIIGFSTFGIPENESIPKIFRFMIDKKYQTKGYGKAAFIEIIKEIFSKYQPREIHVYYHPNKIQLTNFYTGVGFKEIKILDCKNRKEGKMLAIIKYDDFSLAERDYKSLP